MDYGNINKFFDNSSIVNYTKMFIKIPYLIVVFNVNNLVRMILTYHNNRKINNLIQSVSKAFIN